VPRRDHRHDTGPPSRRTRQELGGRADARGRTAATHDIERAIIEDTGLRLVAAQCKTEDEVIEAARDADAVIAQYATVGAKAIDAFTRCRVIARYGTGVDIVDVDAATRRGILVTNVPNDWCQNEVADHAMALLLAAARNICTYDRATRAGTWQWQSGEPIHRMQGRTLGAAVVRGPGACVRHACRGP